MSTLDQHKWDIRFLELAKLVSTWSKDPSTKIGAVIADGKFLVSIGYNGFPVGLKDSDERLYDRDVKYKYIIHGDMNAILNASRSVNGCTMYTYPFMPCSRCAVHIVQSGISRVVSILDTPDNWRHDIVLSENVFHEVGIEITKYDSDSVKI